MGSRGARLIALAISWALIGIWAMTSAMTAGTPADELPAGIALFYFVAAMFHACAAVGAKRAAKLVSAALLIALFAEVLSVHSGFPFGAHQHAAAMGPKFAGAPVRLILDWFGIAWPAWLISRLAIGTDQGDSAIWSQVATALLTALIVTGADSAGVAIASTIRGYWAYDQPGGFFGVPLTDLGGSILTGFAIGLALSFLAQPKRLPPRSAGLFWALAPAFWILYAAQYALYPLAGRPLAAPPTVELADRVWRVHDIYEAAAVIAVLTMLPVALLALARLGQRTDRRAGDAAGRSRRGREAHVLEDPAPTEA